MFKVSIQIMLSENFAATSHLVILTSFLYAHHKTFKTALYAHITDLQSNVKYMKECIIPLKHTLAITKWTN